MPAAPRPASLALAVLVMVAAGCDLAPPYQKPAPELPASFKTAGPWRKATPRDHESRGEWWRAFGDAKLGDLVRRAEANNPGLAAAVHRVEEARALARADGAERLPFVDVSASTRRSRNSGTLQGNFAGGRTITRLRGTLDFDYELDFWGRVRNQAAAGSARADAAQADHRGVMLALQADVAVNYITLRALDGEMAVLKRATEVRRKALDLARKRFAAGDTAQLDVAQAETELAETEAQLIGMEKPRARFEHAIALLIGSTPSAFSLGANPLTGQAPAVPASVPSDLIERRPDIAAAERAMAEMNAEIGVAKAALFPSVRIGLAGGRESSTVAKIANAASRVWGIGPEVTWPLLQGGGTLAKIDAVKARYDAAAEEYRGTVLEAVRDVEDALSDIAVLKRQSAAQAQTVASATRTVELAGKRYESGLVAYYEVLDAQRTLLRVEQEAVRIMGEHFLATVRLIKALGGGW